MMVIKTVITRCCPFLIWAIFSVSYAITLSYSSTDLTEPLLTEPRPIGGLIKIGSTVSVGFASLPDCMPVSFAPECPIGSVRSKRAYAFEMLLRY